MKKPNWNTVLSSHAASAILVFIAAFVYLRISENQLRQHGHEEMYFQPQSSERAAETVGVVDLRGEPVKSLWHIHVYPPLFDGMRAITAAFFSEVQDEELVKKVDEVLYVLWNVAYALLGALLYLWIARMTRRGVGYLAAFVFVLHPKLIYYATVLDATLLAALAMTWLYYELWKLGQGRGRGIGLAASLVLGFFMHPAFQWPLLVVLIGALAAMRVPWKKAAVFAGIAGLVICAYTAKQYAMFGVFSTSTLTYRDSCELMGGCPELTEEDLEEFRDYLAANPPAEAAAVLSREENLEGKNYNALSYLVKHKKRRIAFARAENTGKLVGSYARDLASRLQQRGRISRNVIVDRIPWRGGYEGLLSGWGLIAFVLFSAGVWMWSHRRKKQLLAGAGMALPCLYVFVASPFLDRATPVQFPFVIEPVVFAFVVSQLAAVGVGTYQSIVIPHMHRQWEKAQEKQKDKR